MSDRRILLVGDNPFHGVSHVSQKRAKARGHTPTDPSHAARLVISAMESGAEGFTFTVSQTTLSILRAIEQTNEFHYPLKLYALVPNVSEFVRRAAVVGGIPGLTKNLAREIATSLNVEAVFAGLTGIIKNDPAALLRGLLSYEVSRIKSAAGRQSTLVSVLLHELVTDMALALNMEWLFRAHFDFARKRGLKPGLETRNFAFMINKFDEWKIDLSRTVIAAPFNSIGFQMYPSKEACEEALARIPHAEVIGFSILAGGYLSLPEAIDYVRSLKHLNGVAVGVSTMKQASETFSLLSQALER